MAKNCRTPRRVEMCGAAHETVRRGPARRGGGNVKRREPCKLEGSTPRDPRLMPYRAWFRCIAGCSGEYPLTKPLYRCPARGDLLEVAHDVAALKDRAPSAWMRL